jgi:CCR4-NOT transcriptional complex subunit CAF120
MASAAQSSQQQPMWSPQNQGYSSSPTQSQFTNENIGRRPQTNDGPQGYSQQHQNHQHREEHNLPPTPHEHERGHSRTQSFLSSFRKNSAPVSSSGPSSRNSIDDFGGGSRPRSQTVETISTRSQQPPSPQTNEGTSQSVRRLSTNPNSSQTPTLHPEIRSVVSLQAAQANKVYCAGNLIRRLERLPDGQRPVKDEGWTEVFAQLGGTTLSVWDMAAVNEAAKIGAQVPPSYINVTDAVSFT